VKDVSAMEWCSTISERANLADAVREAVAVVRQRLAGSEPDLVVVFASANHRAAGDLRAMIGNELGSGVVLGCTARSVIGDGREIEERPALSITAACLPGVDVHPFHLRQDEDSVSGDALPVPRGRGPFPDGPPHFLLLSDPFSFDVESFVRGLDANFPGSRKVGGVASGGRSPGENALYLGDRVYHSGLVGVAFSGNLELDTVVAQGCRPIGQPMFVTRCHENVIQELDGRPALAVLQELYRNLTPADQELCRGSLFLGIEMRGAQSEYQQGDFLIRNLLGSDPEAATLAVGALLRETQVVQFHLRDAATSADDLERRLQRYGSELGPRAARGALLFSCLGRGAHLYGHPDHDSAALRRHLGDVALGGFFCNGEIGPVQGTTFLHGYTSAFAIFRERDAAL
jgi:small ligand-binding sensory domain FIST